MVHVRTCLLIRIHSFDLETTLAASLAQGILALLRGSDSHDAPIEALIDLFVGDGSFMVRHPLLKNTENQNAEH